MPTFKLDIVTPERTVYSGRIQSLRAPGSEGGFGVLPRHAPMLAALQTGPLSCVAEDGEHRRCMAVSGGFIEVLHDSVTILAETIEFAEEIDEARAREARDRAFKRLSQPQKIDEARAHAALMRALNRLKVATEN